MKENTPLLYGILQHLEILSREALSMLLEGTAQLGAQQREATERCLVGRQERGSERGLQRCLGLRVLL